MTFQKIKESVVDEQQRMTVKELRKIIIGLALTFLGLVLSIGFATYVVLGFGFTVFVIAFAIAGFNLICNILVEDEKSTKGIKIFSKMWWLFYITLIVIFFVLKLNRFI